MNKNNYKKVEVTDNWGNLTYRIGKNEISGYKKVVRFLYPDGTENKGTVEVFDYSGSYSDMGHIYGYTTKKHTFLAYIHGMKVKLGWDDIKIHEEDVIFAE